MGQFLSEELSPKNKQIAVCYALGLSTKEIAREYDMPIASVRTIYQSALFQLELQRLMANMPDMTEMIRTRLNKVADASLNVLEDLMTMEVKDDFSIMKLQAQHAQEVLSKAGFGSTQNVNSNTKIARGNMLTPEEEELLKAQASEIRDRTIGEPGIVEVGEIQEK